MHGCPLVEEESLPTRRLPAGRSVVQRPTPRTWDPTGYFCQPELSRGPLQEAQGRASRADRLLLLGLRLDSIFRVGQCSRIDRERSPCSALARTEGSRNHDDSSYVQRRFRAALRWLPFCPSPIFDYDMGKEVMNVARSRSYQSWFWCGEPPSFLSADPPHSYRNIMSFLEINQDFSGFCLHLYKTIYWKYSIYRDIVDFKSTFVTILFCEAKKWTREGVPGAGGISPRRHPNKHFS